MLNSKSPTLSEEKDLKNYAPNQEFTYILPGTISSMTQIRLSTKRLNHDINKLCSYLLMINFENKTAIKKKYSYIPRVNLLQL